MFAKHLPPSANLPRVLALDERTAAQLPREIELATDAALVDAIVGFAEPDATLDNLEAFYNRLRPGGRLILAAQADPRSLLEALIQSGYIHCLIEQQAGWSLYRGERPPRNHELADLPQFVADADIDNQIDAPYYYLPVTQTPNQPAWRPTPGQVIQWRTPSLHDLATGQTTLLVFSSLVRAVAFMQKAVLTNTIKDINKVGKFPNAVVKSWRQAFLLNPTFHEVRNRALGPAFEVDPQVAIAGDE